jgi:3-deoxy-D-arabino-heptulosonate 7-phosphate (DAHP) synthase class II
MTQNLARILDEAEQLSVAEREELADRLVESLVRDIPPEIQRAHITEVRRRIAEVASGEVSLVSGDEAMRRVRQLVDAARAGGQ